MEPDALIDEVRDARHEISEECDHDLGKLHEPYQALQRRLAESGRHKIVAAPSVRTDDS